MCWWGECWRLLRTFESPRLQSILQLVLIGGGDHAILWLISDPPTLFRDFQKAYYPAAELLWLHGRAAPRPFTEGGGGGLLHPPVFSRRFAPPPPLGQRAAALGPPR